jgi:hypothetical protein
LLKALTVGENLRHHPVGAARDFMKSGGFLGKKQARTEPAKSLPPTGSDLTHLLANAQKSPDKSFTLAWQSPSGDNSQYILSILIGGGAQRGDRRGWSSSAIDNSGVGEAEWKLHKEVEGKRTEIFSMRSSDAFLIQTFIEDSIALGGAPTPAAAAWTPESRDLAVSASAPQPSSHPSPSTQTQSPAQDAPQASVESHAAAAPATTSTAPFHEGNLRRVNVRTLMEAFNSHKTTGRLICDIGTVTAEVFFTDGEPVHAKSCHSIYGNRDTMGDVSIVDLLTWKEGDFKFQDGWPAASRTVTMPLSMFLSGEAAAALANAAAAIADAAPVPAATSPTAAAPAPAAPGSPLVAGTTPFAGTAGSAEPPDDFSNVDELIGETYAALIETSGLLKYGMFLMLVRCEFVRFESEQNPFCVASIGLRLTNGQLNDAVLRKVGECFESVCKPLDILAYAKGSCMYAMFPGSTHIAAGSALTEFISKLATTPLDTNIHGSSIQVSIGLAEIPSDGFDFLPIFEHASKLRRAATPARRLVISATR